MLLLTRRDIEETLAPAALVSALEAALPGLSDMAIPARAHLHAGESVFLSMPAASDEYWGSKLVTANAANPARGMPAVQGVMVLGDGATGAPLVMMDATALTAQRTGAIGALGLSRIAPTGMRAIGIIGAGVQAVWQTVFAAAILPIERVICLSRSREGFDAFCAELERFAPHLIVEACQDAQALLEATNVVIAATSSATPVLPDDERLLAGKMLVSVGSFRPDMQELPDSAYRLAGAILVDSPDAINEVGDVANAVARGFVPPENVIHIADSRRPEGGTRIFKCVGWAAYDLVAAAFIYRRAMDRKLGVEMDL